MKIKKCLLISFCVILFIIIGIIIFCNLVYNSNESIEQLSQEKIESVKYNSNTVVTGRTGKIFYVSQNGNDSNDGLSENTAWKTLSKVNTSFGARTITNGDTILFERGDKFRGTITVNAHDILIGSYGDEDEPKPEILVSSYNGATQGEWQEVKTNIWKYTVNGQDPFINDVGVIWCFSDSNNLSNTMQNLSGSFAYGQKITTNNNVDDSQLNLSDILKNDLEFYQFGHASARSATGGALYLYSTSNPKNRFSDIEFNISKHGIAFDGCTNLHVDNITIKHAGNHGIGGGTVANLKITNCELGFIGGSTQFYGEDGSPVRFGNAIEIYGNVTDIYGYTVEDGFVVDNNYIYQVYDAGITFQITTDESSVIEKAMFSNNLIEYCNYNIEYWNLSTSSNTTVQENTYINNFTIDNNIMRYAGYGVCTTRPDKGESAIIKTWAHSNRYENRVIGEYKIINNTFSTPAEQMLCIYSSHENSLPKIENNRFYSSQDVKFGYYFTPSNLISYQFSKQVLNEAFPDNEFYYLDEVEHTHDLTLIPRREATCSETGINEYYICSECGKLFKDSEGYMETTIENEIIPINPYAHDWNDWVVTIEPTYTTEGSAERTCKLNNSHKEIETISKVPKTITGIEFEQSEYSINSPGSITVNVKTVPEDATIIPTYSKGLFIGNSLLLGFGTHGMASYSEDSDYYYYVHESCLTRNPNYTDTKINGVEFEGCTTASESNNWIHQTITPVMTSNTDLVIIQLGDNCNTVDKASNLLYSAPQLIEYILSINPNCNIFWVGCWYNSEMTLDYISQACDEYGVSLINISSYNDLSNQASIGDYYIDANGNTQTITNAGVASHPSDIGMELISDKIIEKIFEEKNATDMLKYTWTVEDEDIITIENENTNIGSNIVSSSLYTGNSSIIAEATIGGMTYTAFANVTVNNTNGYSITINNPKWTSLPVSQTRTLNATFNPEEVALEKTITWSSENENVAIVNSTTGKITTKSIGTTIITASDGEKSDTYSLNVSGILGDFDKDSEITSYDAYRALLMSVNQGIEIQNDEDEMVCLDVDRDEEITAWDAYRILIYSIGLISEF